MGNVLIWLSLGAMVGAVAGLIRYVHTRQARRCEFCDGVWDGVCEDCRRKMFPEAGEEKRDEEESRHEEE